MPTKHCLATAMSGSSTAAADNAPFDFFETAAFLAQSAHFCFGYAYFMSVAFCTRRSGVFVIAVLAFEVFFAFKEMVFDTKTEDGATANSEMIDFYFYNFGLLTAVLFVAIASAIGTAIYGRSKKDDDFADLNRHLRA